jgi:hypothetical protein
MSIAEILRLLPEPTPILVGALDEDEDDDDDDAEENSNPTFPASPFEEDDNLFTVLDDNETVTFMPGSAR